MNEVYNFIVGTSVDPFEIIINITLFYLVFEGVISIIVELIRMGRGH